MTLSEWAIASLIISGAVMLAGWLVKVLVNVTEEIQSIDGIENMHLDD